MLDFSYDSTPHVAANLSIHLISWRGRPFGRIRNSDTFKEKMTDADFICAHIARLAFYDGYSEGLDGMLAVACGIRNRVRAGWYNGDWIAVLSHHKEKSADLTPYPEELPDPKIRSIRFLLHEVTHIFNGSFVDKITVATDSVLSVAPPPALYWGHLDRVTNGWFLENVCRKPDQHKRIAVVGALTFFT